MSSDPGIGGRRVEAVHSKRPGAADAGFEAGLAEALREGYPGGGLVELYGRFVNGEGIVDALMRRAIFRAGARHCGSGLRVGSGVAFRHLETFEIEDGVFIGAQANIQGRFDGTCRIGRNSWIGPQAFLDARDLVIGEYVGWGPGARILGSEHVGIPVDLPIIQTDLVIKPVRIGDWADIGTNAVILPGVTIGKGAIVGAGAVVTADVAPFSVVAGVPARLLRWRSSEEIDALQSRGMVHA
ncbi:MAG: N-acetyltransferase [Devosia sp.]|uniref:acyltransferase n=1 Tax=Devosia sp. TaxID=1871048 RepID=UPI00261CBD51|nr:acyltransferase [Devosia sp.]MDB5540177.1 N-acetyltransferase [Devosia sp.]